MKIVNSSYEVILPMTGRDMLRHIERAGRTCYKSDKDDIDDNRTDKFVKRLIDSHHESVLEHVSFSVKFVMSRGTYTQFKRHRIGCVTDYADIDLAESMESQRYCKYGDHVTFIRPLYVPETYLGTWNYLHNYDEDGNLIFSKDSLGTTLCATTPTDWTWAVAMFKAEELYKHLLDKEFCRITSQEAREVLPNSCKTEFIATTNLRQWRHILIERTSKHADPEIRRLVHPLLDELKITIPVIFDDITY